MPLPFIIAGLAVAATGIVGHAAQEVANDYEAELNSINRSMEKMKEETNVRIIRSKDNFESRINTLSVQRQRIYNTTLTKFSEVFSQLKNVEFEKDTTVQTDITKFRQNILEFNDNSSYKSELWSKTSTSVVTSLLFGVAGGGIMFAGGFIKSMKLSYKIDEAKAERSKLRAACETAEKKCLQIDSLTQYCKTAYDTISSLKMLTDLSVKQVTKIIDEAGTDYKTYSLEQRQKIRMGCNFAMALNDIANTEIFDNQGNINPQFKKYIDGVQELKQQGA
ncbi:hypothetical protein [Clostridium fungisolvens]|uniref:Uncharacterized protein n=1 Tax=Clostridium fungisolvens TaxID=1604897 RepID=A0A6V8SHH7_9CLOT|nr:hypothetical protein [Clostridium fungisolvens]GFP76251.1 hypothetical protein bsdtw1_02352 [Clostridium fungisolvens]